MLNALKLDYIDVDLGITIDVQASSQQDAVVTSGAKFEEEKVTFRVTFKELYANISMFVAIHSPAVDALRLGSLYNSPAACVSSTVYNTNVTNLEGSVRTFEYGHMTGFISAGLSRMMNNVIDTADFMFKDSALRAMPQAMKFYGRSELEDMVKQYVHNPQNTACPAPALRLARSTALLTARAAPDTADRPAQL